MTDFISLLKDISVGSQDSISSYPSNFTVFNGSLYFAANDGINGLELWKTDGTAQGTVLFKDIYTGNSEYGYANSSAPDRFTVFNGSLYFAAYDGNGYELWKTDGTAQGTVLVQDIYTGSQYGYPNSSSPYNFTVFNGSLYFVAYDGINGTELWKTDGTAQGTVLVQDIYTGSQNDSPNSSSPYNFTEFNGSLYFTANDGINGDELWKTDGTAQGTVLFKDIYTGNNGYSVYSSSPSNFTVFNGSLYFAANDGINGNELWKTDGTAQGTVLFKDIYTGNNQYGSINSSYPSNFTVFNGSLYFVANDGINGNELWKTDGTAQGTVLVKDIYTGNNQYGNINSSAPDNFTVFNGSLYFTAYDGNGSELWKTDGTAQGTVLVQDIYTGSQDGYPNSSSPDSLTVFNGSLYFVANDGINGKEVFVLTAGLTNNAPTVATPIADRTVATNTPISFTFAANSFSDSDGDTLTYTTNTLPAGLTFDAATRTLSGTVTTAGTNTIEVTADDGNGGTVTDSFVLTSTTPTLGTVNNDTFTGTAGIDVLNGLDGNDSFTGTAGADVIDGGVGKDRIDYKNSPVGIIVNLLTGINSGGDAEGDILNSVEEIFGSAFADDLTGNSTDHTLYGGGGNDTIRAGTGKGYLRGNAGNDLMYGGSNIDRLLGDEDDDTIYGGGGNDILKGWTGNDNLFGDEGNDTIYGEDGNDTLTGASLTTFGVTEQDRLFGGAGNDIFVLGDSSRAYYNDGNALSLGVADYARIADFNSAEDTVRLYAGATYYLGAKPLGAVPGTGLFIDNDGISGLSAKDELIGLFENTTLTYGQVTGGTAGFSFISAQ